MTKPATIILLAMMLSSDVDAANGHLRKFPYDISRYLSAISAVESGNDDHAHGKKGELSAFQITKATWHRNCSYPFTPPYTTSRKISGEVAAKHLVWIHTTFVDQFGQMPVDSGTYYVIYNVGWQRYLRYHKHGKLPMVIEKRKLAFQNILKSL